ncbi:hypothetical protein [Bacillus coahuilensis]|uniref:hypothetical protein n=1 Tax=Bacillus coahuilensis TaxID=408580 RepID=UPI0001851241|nr:hypothetical protein [Bacillus coahuilensis]
MDKHENVVIKREEEKNSSMVASTFIKYAAYLIIFFGIIWFLINYVWPVFS